MSLTQQPRLGYVKVMRLPLDTAGKLADVLDSYVRDSEPDSYGEWEYNVTQPLPKKEVFNGGCWIEKFTDIQIVHMHADDGTGANERYLFLIPRGADGMVDILPRDSNNPAQDGERYIFTQDHIHMLHFDGACPHRFATMGSGPDCSLLAVAFHTRDVATSQEALTEQTRPLEFSMPEPAMERVFPAPTVSVPRGHIDYGFQGFVDDIRRQKGTLDPRTYVPTLFYELANHVLALGTGYGASKFSKFASLTEWHDYIFGRQFLRTANLNTQTPQVPRLSLSA